MTPLLKWAGGKTQLLNIILEKMPTAYNNYYEPFLGGASVLFSLAPTKAYINDINPQLINLYCQIKNSVEAVIEQISELDRHTCCNELYLSIRKKYNEKIEKNILDEECAALLIWLNKHCFNGLYRVNKKGLFNVPYNNDVNIKSFDEQNILAVSEYLRTNDITITCEDFEQICKNVEKNDFVYFDSPYIPESISANFSSYTMFGFTNEDHKRLSVLYKKLDSLGAKIMLSNNDVPLVYDLYSEYNIYSFPAKRLINRNANNRTGREVIITNY